MLNCGYLAAQREGTCTCKGDYRMYPYCYQHSSMRTGALRHLKVKCSIGRYGLQWLPFGKGLQGASNITVMQCGGNAYYKYVTHTRAG